MYSLLFRNRLGALGFVLLTVAGAASLVGSEDNEGVIAKTTKTIETQRAEFAEVAGSMSEADAAPDQTQIENIEIAGDDDLIDDAAGYDPTPDIFASNPAQENGEVAEKGEVVMVIMNERPKE